MNSYQKEKIITFKFESEMPDIGVYTKRLKLLRRTPRLSTAFITTKSALTGGLAPLTRSEMLMIDTIATLTVYVRPINEKGDEVEEHWIDEIYDSEILFAIHKEWLDYQDSFYPKKEGLENGSNT